LCFFFNTIIFTEREGRRKKGDRQKEEKPNKCWCNYWNNKSCVVWKNREEKGRKKAIPYNEILPSV